MGWRQDSTCANARGFPLRAIARHCPREGEAGGMKRKRKSKGPYVAVPKAILGAPAWRAMSPGARLLWIDMRGWLRNDDLNNGQVHRSCRAAADSIGTKSKSSIVRWFAENEHYGFLRKTADGFLGSEGRGIAAKYRFTDLALGTHPPTRDYEKWEGEMFVYTPRRGGRKKQNPVRTTGRGRQKKKKPARTPGAPPTPPRGKWGGPPTRFPYVLTRGT